MLSQRLGHLKCSIKGHKTPLQPWIYRLVADLELRWARHFLSECNEPGDSGRLCAVVLLIPDTHGRSALDVAVFGSEEQGSRDEVGPDKSLLVLVLRLPLEDCFTYRLEFAQQIRNTMSVSIR